MRLRLSLLLLASALGFTATKLPVRSRSEHNGQWRVNEQSIAFDPEHTAIILCDMWDKHWCRGANTRVGQLVQKAEPFLQQLRKKGVLVIHAPSNTMDFYESAPQRKAILALPSVPPPQERILPDPPLPIDDTDGGCDTSGDKMYRAWTRQHAGLTIGPDDLITDNGTHVYNALRHRRIETLLIMGVHTNMCILNRTFAIKQMTRWGVRCLLVRDMTDAMYDPQDRPFVSHDRGTELVVEHIEKHWAPSVLSAHILAALR
ncbi:MAG: cysteine hydrolase family protein [Bryobacterales bacterium]|nr:cysteine hydrolase family protein [Bryobacterales bacterium]